jgi:hypothetical protein
MPFGDANTCLANLSICPQAVQNRIEVAKACIQNIPQCPQQIVARAGYEVARPIVDSYIASLRAQAVGKYRSLPDAFVQSYQRFYTVDLHSIQYATGIDTVHGNAITIGTEIYFPWAMDLNTLNSSALMFHELEHTVQYRNRGGIEPFLAEYIAKSFGKIIQRKSFDIHDDIDIEGAAIAKSKEVVNNGYCSPERGPPAECR